MPLKEPSLEKTPVTPDFNLEDGGGSDEVEREGIERDEDKESVAEEVAHATGLPILQMLNS